MQNISMVTEGQEGLHSPLINILHALQCGSAITV